MARHGNGRAKRCECEHLKYQHERVSDGSYAGPCKAIVKVDEAGAVHYCSCEGFKERVNG